jgi:hypothetical protein
MWKDLARILGWVLGEWGARAFLFVFVVLGALRFPEGSGIYLGVLGGMAGIGLVLAWWAGPERSAQPPGQHGK